MKWIDFITGDGMCERRHFLRTGLLGGGFCIVGGRLGGKEPISRAKALAEFAKRNSLNREAAEWGEIAAALGRS